MFDDRDFTMDVQVGPEEEITVSVGETPVDIAKKNPGTVCVAGKHREDGVCEFFVEFDDVANFAELNEMCLIDALDTIVAYHENTNTGITRDNLITIVDENSINYVDELEAYGANCMYIVSEADDISMDVQVGPEGDEIRISEDPQEANPVDAVKREYDNVIIAKQGDEFFTDVEDVQKCAELNCESVIDTLNGIIAVNENVGVDDYNLVVLVNETTDPYIFHTLANSTILMEANYSFLPQFAREPAFRRYMNDLKEAEDILNDSGYDLSVNSHKIGRVCIRILDIFNSVDSVILLPVLFTIVGIPYYLMDRLMNFCLKNGEEDLAIKEGRRVIDHYDHIIKNTSDPKIRKSLEKSRDDLQTALDKFNNIR